MNRIGTVLNFKRAYVRTTYEKGSQEPDYEFDFAGAKVSHIKGDEARVEFTASGNTFIINVAADMNKVFDIISMSQTERSILARIILTCRPLHGLHFEKNEEVLDREIKTLSDSIKKDHAGQKNKYI